MRPKYSTPTSILVFVLICAMTTPAALRTGPSQKVLGSVPGAPPQAKAGNSAPQTSLRDAAAAHASSLSPQTLNPAPWQEKAKVTSRDGTQDERFGYSVAVSGNTAVVGEYPFGGQRAFVYVRTDQTWEYVQTLQSADNFGEVGYAYTDAYLPLTVAISGDTILVGAPFADISNEHGGFNVDQGAVYVFKRENGVWIEKTRLIANEYSLEFGKWMAFDGKTAIINGLYVFEEGATGWTQQKLPGTGFGTWAAISGDTIAVIGREGTASDGSDFVSTIHVFIRNGTAWQEKQVLTTSDHMPGDVMGEPRGNVGIAISGDTIIAGYINGGTANTPPDPNRHGAYIFVRRNGVWTEQQKLKPLNATAGLVSVAISGNTAVLGYQSDAIDGQQYQGAAYVFERTGETWFEEQRLTASDGKAYAYFGQAVAMNGGTLIVGAPYTDVENESLGLNRSQGAAYIFQTDEADMDGDALPDEWEKHGVTIDGTFIDLPAMGADPTHKDIFVHVDWMLPDPANPLYFLRPDPRAIKIVTDSFAVAPVANPDGKPGINLHVDTGSDSIMNPVTGETWGSYSRAGDVPFQEFIDMASPPTNQSYYDALVPFKASHFTPSKRGAIFHYALYGSKINREPNILGLAPLGTELVLGLNTWRQGSSGLLKEANTFMHELGHNLGLEHGGIDEVNRKPNYLSIMNYKFQVIGTLRPDSQQRSIDYSRQLLPTLDETDLDESVGINDPAMHSTLWNPWTRSDEPAGSNKCINNRDGYFKLFYPSQALDWDCNGVVTPTRVSADLNNDGKCVRTPELGSVFHTSPSGDDVIIGPFITAGPNHICESTRTCDPQNPTDCDIQMQPVGSVDHTQLIGFNDWAVLVFDGGGRLGKLPATQSSITTKSSRASKSSLTTESATASPLPHELSMEELLAEAPPSLLNEEAVAPLDVVTPDIQAGPAPFLASFDGSGSTAVGGATIVNWTWNFGDGSTGSGATASHTYTTPGTYFASLTVKDNNGHVNLVPLLHRVTVGNSLPRPNLTTYQPAGWSDKVVVSNTTGTNMDSAPFTDADTYYVDLSILNNGTAATSAPFEWTLYVDGLAVQASYIYDPLGPNGFVNIQDVPIGQLTAGQHSIKVRIDKYGEMAETDETDNDYTRVIDVVSSAPVVFKSLKDGSWGDPCTWNPANSSGSCPNYTPAPTSDVEITHNVTGGGECKSLLLKGSVGVATVHGPATIDGGTVNTSLTVEGVTTFTGNSTLNGPFRTTNNITVGGSLSGTGNIWVKGASPTNTVTFTNNGSVSLAYVSFGEDFFAKADGYRYVIGGIGSWNITGPAGLRANNGNTVEVGGTQTMGSTALVINTDSTLLVNGALTFRGGDIISSGTITVGTGRLDVDGTNFYSNGTLDIGSSTLSFTGTGEFSVGGPALGTGTISIAPSDGNCSFNTNRTYSFTPAVLIASGTAEHHSSRGVIGGPLTVAAGATFTLSNSQLWVYNDITVGGTLNYQDAVGSASQLYFNGSTFTNNGSVAAPFISLNSSGASGANDAVARTQTIKGTGAWGGEVILSNGATASGTPVTTTLNLLNDVTFNGIVVPGYNGAQFRNATVNLADHTLTFAGDKLNGSGGTITGTGLVRIQPQSGAATITSGFSSFAPGLKIVSGTVTVGTVNVIFNGPLTVDAGATLTLGEDVTGYAASATVNGNVTINGTLNKIVSRQGDSSHFTIVGGALTNNGVINGGNVFFHFGTTLGPTNEGLAGTGTWTGGWIIINPKSTTSLLGDMTFAGDQIWIDGRVNTGAFTLHLPCGVAWGGTGEAVGNVHRLSMNGCSGPIAFGNALTTINFTSGTAPSDVFVNIALASPPDLLGAVSRTYVITPSSGSGYAATLRLRYLDSELNGNPEATLQLWRKDAATGWKAQGASNRNTTDNWVEVAGVTQFSPWTLSSPPVNSPPVATDDAATTQLQVAVTIPVLANDTDRDGDTLTVTGVGSAPNGTVVKNANNTVTYTPKKRFTGTDSFTYTISDGHGGTATARVTVLVKPPNSPPVARSDSATTTINTPVVINVLANDTDPNGDPLTVSAVTQGSSGAVSINANSTVTYTPKTGFKGRDSFTYTVSDGNGGSATAAVTVRVQ